MTDLKELLVHEDMDMDFMDAADKKLAIEARKVLGWEVLGHELETNELEKKLRSMEITWFTEDSVERYKKEQAKRTRKAFIIESRKNWPWPIRWLRHIIPAPNVGAQWIMGAVGDKTTGMRRDRLFSGGWSEEYYTDTIPKDALSIAVAIKKDVPKAGIYVDYLQVDYMSRISTIDPFLVVEFLDRYYYVAVWDEPDYKAEVVR